MATYTPPPYFPQSSLAPPDKNRYRKFKFIVAVVLVLLLFVLVGVGFGVWYLMRTVFWPSVDLSTWFNSFHRLTHAVCVRIVCRFGQRVWSLLSDV